MKKAKKILSLMLAVLMCFSCMFVPTYAATSINYSPYPKVEYSYSSGVTVGTIRYIAQNPTSPYFNWNYWPRNSFGGYGSPESECGTACISMALSYVGVDRTPKVLLESTNGYTGSMWGQQGNASSKSISKSTSAVSNAMNDYINGNGKYSPLCVYIVPFSSTSSMHWVLLVGKIDNNKYLALNPWHTSGTNGTFVIQINGTTATYNGTTNPISSINQWHNPNASIPSSEPTKIIYPTDGGIYKIAAGVGNNQYLDFSASTTNVKTYENVNNPDQIFKLIHIGDGWYTISSTGNKKLVDVANANPASGTNIQQCVANGSDAQLFRFYDAGDGYCYIKSKLGCYVDVANGDNANNTNIWAYSFNGSNAQKWKLEKHTHSYTSSITTQPTCTKTGVKTFTCYCTASYTETIGVVEHFDNNGNNRCDVCDKLLIAEPNIIIYPDDGSIVKLASGVGNNMYLDFNYSNNNVQIYEDCDGHSNPNYVKGQYFKLNHVGDGWYTIVNIGNGNCLDTENENPASGTNLMHWECYFNNGQLFRFYDAGNGYCFVKSKLGCYIDVSNGGNTNNTNVQMYKFNGTDAQKWKLMNHSHSYTSIIDEQSNVDKMVETFDCYCGTNYTETVAKNAYTTVYKGTTYILYDGSVTYADAKEFCEKIGGHLVKITSQEENDVVADLVTSFGHISWINGTDEIEEGTWLFDDGEAMTFFNWDEGEPNSHQGNDQDYLALNIRTKWDDYHGSAYGFICEFDHTHSYTSKITKEATCKNEGIKTFTCSCGESYTEAIAKKSHTIVTDKAVSATCTKTGLTEGKHCSACGTVTVAPKTVAALGHNDANGDYKCDNGCGYEFEKPAPDTPSDPSENCDCNCHKGGIAGFFFKLINFFQKIFGKNKVCACGAAHY